MTCLTCRRISKAFDPYLSVQLPLIKEEKIEFCFVPDKSHDLVEDLDGEPEYDLNPFIVCEFPSTKTTTVANVKEAMIERLRLDEKFGITKGDLVIANQRQGRISEIFPNNLPVFEIEQRSDYTMVYHVPGRAQEGAKAVELNFYQWKKRGAKSYTVDRLEKSCPKIVALTPETTLMELKRLILDKYKGIFYSANAPEGDEAINEQI